jgi:CRP/FNR family transcriptional regulator, cyclic AMP receptor protein
MPASGSLQEFLSRLNAEERRLFDEAARTIRISKGQTVIGQGPGGTDVYFIEEGALQVLIYSKTGKQVSIRTLRRGDCFGELAALDDGVRSADVVALTEGRLVQMSGAAFVTLLQSSPRAGFWLIQHLVTQVRVLTERIFELSALNVRSRLHCELLRLGVQSGVKENQARIRPAPTHVELANRIGTHREGVTREMRSLARQGLLEQLRRELVVHDIAELSRLVSNAVGERRRVLPLPKPANDVLPVTRPRRATKTR